MKEPLEECVEAIRSMFDRTPPDVRRGIEDNGIYLTGGLANLRGLSTYLKEVPAWLSLSRAIQSSVQ